MSPPLPRVPGFTVLSEVARGGQGVVYRARHDASGGTVALKLLLDHDPSVAIRFKQEGRVLAALRHPHLLRVCASGEEQGVPYLGIEFIEGEDLGKLVKRGGTPPTEWIGRVLALVAHTLQFCHEQGVIHRDLKPANVVIEQATQRPVLVDFGLVKRDPNQLHLQSMDGAVLSQSGTIKGTPEYMAPEQVNPTVFGEVDPRTDVYALGATLFHLLTGRPPFVGRVAVIVMRKVTRKDPPDPRSLNPNASAALSDLALRCLVKQRDDRPSSAAEFAALVAQAAGIPPVSDPRLATPPLDPELRKALSDDTAATEVMTAAQHRKLSAPGGFPRPGDRFAGHLLERELARGGGGAVYVAHRERDGRVVAIKVLLGDHSDPTKAERFEREFAAGRELNHANVVQVFEHGVDGGRAYLSMELLDGAVPLDRFAQEGERSVDERLQLMLQLADAIQAAHEVGLVHRDLKPDNVLVLPTGQVKVVDFGIARHLDKARLTLSGQVMGTVSYMAPEQVRGRAAQADARTDVYALGVILYELLTGKLPYEGSTNLEVMAAILDDSVPDPAALVPELPAGLTHVVQMAMARDPQDRYASAAALGRDLAAAASGSAVSAVDLARAATRRRWLGRGSTALVVACLLVLGGTWWARRPRWLSAEQLREQAQVLAADAGEALAQSEVLLEGDAPKVSALAGRLEALLQGADPGHLSDPQLSRTVERAAERVHALQGLSALAGGDRARAATILEQLGESAESPASEALRGALAAETGQGDPSEAERRLSRALARGIDRPELRGWRVRSAVRAGLETPTAADEVLADLEVLAQARGGRLSQAERELAVWAHLAKGDEAKAEAELDALTEPSSPLRWATALALAAARLEADPARVLASLEALPPLVTQRPEALVIAKRVEALLAREVRQSAANAQSLASKPPEQARLEQTAIDSKLEAWFGIREVLLPGQRVSVEFAKALVEAAAGLLKRVLSEPGLRLAIRIAASFPEVKSIQNSVGSKSQVPWSASLRLQLLPAVRRSIELEEDPGERRELNRLLLESLAGIARLNTPECKRCADEALAHSESMLADEREETARATIFAHRSTVYQASDQWRAALTEIEQAIRLNDVEPQFKLKRAWILFHLQERSEQVLTDAAAFLRQTEDRSGAADGAARMLWELGLRLRRHELAQWAAERQIVLRPTNANWQYRLAWLLDQRGEPRQVVLARLREADRVRTTSDFPAWEYLVSGGKEKAEAVLKAFEESRPPASALLEEVYAGIEAEKNSLIKKRRLARQAAWREARANEGR